MDRHAVLVALGPGGTTELAERVLELLAAQMAERDLDPRGPMELGGLAEVCKALGKSRQQVGHWVSGRRPPRGLLKEPPPFPEPLAELDATPVYDLAAVRDWARTVGVIPVEPREEG